MLRALYFVIRIPGVCLALLMFSASLFPVGFMYPGRREEQLFSTFPYTAFLYGPFLVPFSLLRPLWLWVPAFSAVTIAAMALGFLTFRIFGFYYHGHAPDRSLTLFFISLLGVTGLLQPLAVLAARLTKPNDRSA